MFVAQFFLGGFVAVQQYPHRVQILRQLLSGEL